MLYGCRKEASDEAEESSQLKLANQASLSHIHQVWTFPSLGVFCRYYFALHRKNAVMYWERF